jgi:hypothetical protein
MPDGTLHAYGTLSFASHQSTIFQSFGAPINWRNSSASETVILTEMKVILGKLAARKTVPLL